VTPANRNVRVIGQDEFTTIIGSYMDPSLAAGDYFSDGQVLLVYDGDIDPCAAHVEFSGGITLGTITDASVKLVLSYQEKALQDKCSAQPENPFAFYYVKTKKELITEQNITQ